MRRLLPLPLLALAFVPASVAAQQRPAEPGCFDGAPREAIPAVRAAYMEAFNAGRVEDVVELHAEDVVSMPAGMPPLEGREPLRDLMTESARAAPEGFRFAFEATELRVAEGWAVERGITRAGGGEGGVPGGKYVLLYERDDEGCWRIAWSITNSDER